MRGTDDRESGRAGCFRASGCAEGAVDVEGGATADRGPPGSIAGWSFVLAFEGEDEGAVAVALPEISTEGAIEPPCPTRIGRGRTAGSVLTGRPGRTI